MHPPFRSWRRGAASALAALVAGALCAPAQAQVSFKATAANLRYTLIDLDPNDGVAPATSFVDPLQFGLLNMGTVDRLGQPQQGWRTTSPNATPVTAPVTAPTRIEHDLGAAGHATAAYDGQRLQVEGHLAGNSGAAVYLSDTASTFGQIAFTLSPHTGIRFSLDASVDLALGAAGQPADGAFGTGEMILVYQLDDYSVTSDFARVAGGVGRNADGTLTPDVHDARTITVGWDNLNNVTRSGSLEYYASASGWVSAAPVPEPGEWAMMGVGGALLAWRGRRRQRAAGPGAA